MKSPTELSAADRPDLPQNGIKMEIVKSIAEIFMQHELTEIEIETGQLRIRVARQLLPAAQPSVLVPAAMAAQQTAPAAAVPPREQKGAVKSPMVGTAYLRPSPDANPFAPVGAKVKAGDRILLVEAMKTFNEINAPHGGVVTAILIEDGQAVEYGEPLMVIEPVNGS